MDEVYQVLVNVTLGKTVIYLESTTEMLCPEVVTEIIWIEDYLPSHEFLHHPFRQVIADTNCQPVDIRECQ